MLDNLVILTPREVEILKRDAPAQGENAALLTMIRERIVVSGRDHEIELTDGELERIDLAQRLWRNGGQLQFSTLAAAIEQRGIR